MPEVNAIRSTVAVAFRFCLFGGLNTMLGFSIYAGLSWIGLHFTLASLISLIVGIIAGHWGSRNLVFRSSRRNSFVRYVILWGGLYLVNISLIALSISLGLTQIWAGAAAVFIVVPLSFILQRSLVFST
jgi:putative flippase GtrA